MAAVLRDIGGIDFGAPELPLSDRRNRVMWLNNDRVFFAGLLGAHGGTKERKHHYDAGE